MNKAAANKRVAAMLADGATSAFVVLSANIGQTNLGQHLLLSSSSIIPFGFSCRA
jgi:hypothetical protein